MSHTAQVQTAEVTWCALLREEILSNAAFLFPDVESPRIIVFGPRISTQALLVAKSSRFLPFNVVSEVVLCAGPPAQYIGTLLELSANLRVMLKNKIERDNELAKGVEEKVLEEFERLTEGVKDKEVAEGVKKALRKEALAEIEKKQREREQEIADGVAAIMARRNKDIPSTTLGEPEPTEMADGMQARKEEQVRRRALPDRAESFLARLARQKDVQKVCQEKREQEAMNEVAAFTARGDAELPPKSKPVQEANPEFQRKALYRPPKLYSEAHSRGATPQFAVPEGGFSAQPGRSFIAEFRQDMETFRSEIQPVRKDLLQAMKAFKSEIEAVRKDLLDMFEEYRPGTCTPSTSSEFTEHEEALYYG